MLRIALCAALLLGLAVDATAGVILDQHFDPTDSGGSIQTNGPETVGGYKNRTWAQTFTAGLTGRLDKAELYLHRYQTADDLLVFVHRVPVGPPYLSTAVGSVVVSPSAVRESSVFYGGGGNGAWTTVDLSSLAIDITAGERLAISLEKESGDDGAYGWFYLQNGLSSNQHLDYTGGNAFHFRYLGEPADLFFRTYVDTAAVPLPAAAWAGLLLLGGLGALRRIRRRGR